MAVYKHMIILYVTSSYFNHPVTFSVMLNVITPTNLNGTMYVRVNRKVFKIKKFSSQKRIKICGLNRIRYKLNCRIIDDQ